MSRLRTRAVWISSRCLFINLLLPRVPNSSHPKEASRGVPRPVFQNGQTFGQAEANRFSAQIVVNPDHGPVGDDVEEKEQVAGNGCGQQHQQGEHQALAAFQQTSEGKVHFRTD